MPALVYGVPYVGFKKAAVARIKSSTLYGPGTIPGSVTTPASKRLQAIYDNRPATGAVFPYLLWGSKDATPDGRQTTVFHQAGVEAGVQAHVYSDQLQSFDNIDEIIDRLVAMFHRQSITIAGFLPFMVGVDSPGSFTDPVGGHGVVNFTILSRVVQT